MALGRMHKGIDIANNTGTAIHAARAGTVTYAGWMGAYGYMVEISTLMVSPRATPTTVAYWFAKDRLLNKVPASP